MKFLKTFLAALLLLICIACNIGSTHRDRKTQAVTELKQDKSKESNWLKPHPNFQKNSIFKICNLKFEI